MTADPGPPDRLDPEEGLELLFRDLGSSPSGLAEREAARRLEQHGPNAIQRRERSSRLRELGVQFTHPLALLLWAAAALALVGGLVPLAMAIVAVIVLNAVFAFVQEVQAERATEALQEYLPPLARVRRGGRAVEVEATALVPGDVVLISEGDRLSADARSSAARSRSTCRRSPASPQPVVRTSVRARPAASPSRPTTWSSAAASARAARREAVVYATGMATQLGRIAALSQRVQHRAEPAAGPGQPRRAAHRRRGRARRRGVPARGALVAGLPLDDA